jgi:hypothetical protein
MGGGLQADLGKMRNGITAPRGHLFDLIKNQVVVIRSKRGLNRESENHDKYPRSRSSHAEQVNAKVASGNGGWRSPAECVRRKVNAVFHKNERRGERFRSYR